LGIGLVRLCPAKTKSSRCERTKSRLCSGMLSLPDRTELIRCLPTTTGSVLIRLG
jgi:hypothetical protein